MSTSPVTNLNNFTMTNQVTDASWQWHLLDAMNNLDFHDEDLEVVIGGTSVYEIEGAGTKWAPVKGTRKYNKDAFIILRKKSEVVSSEPLEDFNPQHDAYEWDHADAPTE